MVTSWGRRKFTPRSKSSCSASPSPDSASWRIGTLDALKLRMRGGVVPGGYERITVCEIAVIWALAVSSRAPGWR
jgi:hypothetical protein